MRAGLAVVAGIAGIAGAALLVASPVGGGAALAMEAAPAGPTSDAAKAAFAPCAVCHATAKGVNKLGPSLYGVAGRKIASVPGFAYSPALKAKGGGVWTDAALKSFISNPMGAVPGTRMMYPGQKDPAKLAALVQYLKTVK